MRKLNLVILAAVGCFLCASPVRADSDVVTSAPNALNATMSSTYDNNSGFTTFTAQGKVSPKFRSEGGTSVILACTKFCALIGTCTTDPNPTVRFPSCNDNSVTCAASVDSCGNFSFQWRVFGTLPQLDSGYSCRFIVNTDVSKGVPQSCNKTPTGDLLIPKDPNGSAPCSGGYCPVAP